MVLWVMAGTTSKKQLAYYRVFLFFGCGFDYWTWYFEGDFCGFLWGIVCFVCCFCALVKPRLRIRNLLQLKMTLNLKKYSIFYPHCSKTTVPGKNFRAFLASLPFSASSQSLTRNLG
jgi:hypothetical protein